MSETPGTTPAGEPGPAPADRTAELPATPPAAATPPPAAEPAPPAAGSAPPPGYAASGYAAPGYGAPGHGRPWRGRRGLLLPLIGAGIVGAIIGACAMAGLAAAIFGFHGRESRPAPGFGPGNRGGYSDQYDRGPRGRRHQMPGPMMPNQQAPVPSAPTPSPSASPTS
ncbi:MAG: hypothetical protein QOD41_2450 [Cryptosporangiaceae bacterium]|nr:hypothetical protein [Cryptosporangiaceae bacterium]